MLAGGYPGDGRWREVSRGVGDAAPYGLPGNGRQREPPPHPALRGHLPPRGKAGLLLAAAQASAGRRGRRTLRFARGRAVTGACPSSGPAGPPSPKGEGKGCRGGIHPSRGVGGGGRSRRGGGTPPYGWGYGNAVGFTWAPVSGPPRGRGRACPARGVTQAPSMVRSVGRGLDPSAGVGGSGSLRGW